jgi:hypothetical protein
MNADIKEQLAQMEPQLKQWKRKRVCVIPPVPIFQPVSHPRTSGDPPASEKASEAVAGPKEILHHQEKRRKENQISNQKCLN